MFPLSKRRGSDKYQVRKRWPSDVAAILKGEFTRTTGETDRRKAATMIPLIAADYFAKVEAARARLADNKQRDLTAQEVRRLAAAFYRDALPYYRVKGPLGPTQHQELLKNTRATVAHLEASKARNDFGAVAKAARGIISREGLPVPENSPSMPTLEEMLMRASIELHRGVVAQLEGVTDYVPVDSTISDLAHQRTRPERTVTALIKAYEEEKGPRWSISSQNAVAPAFRFLRGLFGDREVTSLTREDAKEAQRLLQSLPKGLGKIAKLKDLPILEAIERGQQLNLPTLEPGTINRGYLVHIAALFNFAVREQWLASNPFSGLSVHDPVEEQDKRDSFTTEQLRAIFTAGPWDKPLVHDDERPGRYWAPLIALFTGMRLGEICGLRIRDAEEDQEGRLILRIRPYEGRTLKNKESRRDLPIHAELRRMGLEDFVAHRRAVGQPDDLLFPDGRPNARRQFGAKLSERFAGLLRDRDVSGVKLGMHSFRHTVEDRLRDVGLHGAAVALAMTGRAVKGSAKRYGSGFTAAMLVDPLNRISHPGLDLSHLYTRQEGQ